MPPKAPNVFAADILDSDRMYVNDVIITVVAKSPTAALAAALESFKTAASKEGKGIAFSEFKVTYHDMRTYTVRAWRE